MKTIIKKKDNFTTISNSIILDNSMSFKAKGLLIYMLSRPNNWNFKAKEIASNSKDGVDSVYSGLKELITSKYISRKKNYNGTLDYYIFEDKNENKIPDYLDLNLEKPNREKPDLEKPDLDNPRLYKTKNYTKERITLKKDRKIDNNINIALEKIKAIGDNQLKESFINSNVKKLVEKLSIEIDQKEILETLDKIPNNEYVMGEWKDKYNGNNSQWVSSILKLENFIKISSGHYDKRTASVLSVDKSLLEIEQEQEELKLIHEKYLLQMQIENGGA